MPHNARVFEGCVSTMLDPYRVLDFTDERGELSLMLLGDLGADVIRVEPPEGRVARRVPPSGPSESLSFQAFNRNKRSIVLHNGDRDVLESLVRSADFLFESAWPSTLAPFRLDPEVVRTINPHIVHVRVSPFGSDGPSADYLGNDLVIAAMGGLVSLQGPAIARRSASASPRFGAIRVRKPRTGPSSTTSFLWLVVLTGSWCSD